MDDVQHYAHLAQVRSALAGLLLQAREWIPEVGPADSVSVSMDADGTLTIEYQQNGATVAGEGA